AALDELGAFELKYIQAVYGEAFVADMQQMAGMMALYPSFATMASRMEAERGKLDGTALSTTVLFEAVRRAEQLKQAEQAIKSSATTATRMDAVRGNLDGTALSITVLFEAVRSAEQLKQAEQSSQSSGGGGIGGMLGRRIMGSRGAPEPRSMVLRTTHEIL